jgi:hypothetical protein
MEKKIINKKNKISEPVLYPPLRNNISNLENVDHKKISEIGRHSLNILKLIDLSIYKLLYSKEHGTQFNVHGIREMRNRILKSVVELNNDYFPNELLQDEYKKKEVSDEEKHKITMSKWREAAKNEKLSISREESLTKGESFSNDITSRKSSMRRDSIDLGEVYVPAKINNEGELEQGKIMHEDEDEKTESNKEEQSYDGDEFIPDSDVEDGGSDKEYSNDEGGAF